MSHTSLHACMKVMLNHFKGTDPEKVKFSYFPTDEEIKAATEIGVELVDIGDFWVSKVGTSETYDSLKEMDAESAKEAYHAHRDDVKITGKEIMIAVVKYGTKKTDFPE